MAAAGVVWGMKLESRYDKIEEQLSAAREIDARQQAIIDAGILPRTEERIRAHDMRITDLENRIDRDEQAINLLRGHQASSR